MSAFPVYVGDMDTELFLSYLYIHPLTKPLKRRWSQPGFPGGRMIFKGVECALIIEEGIVLRQMGKAP
jgi:hypothetical protein